MNIVVCIKQVPEVADAELEINKHRDSIDTEDLVMGINEWDNYAVEEGLRLKEKYAGSVTVVTIGDEDAEDILRRALAMGADNALHIEDEDFVGSDEQGIARGLGKAIEEIPYDLILTGAQSSDLGSAQVGPRLAEILGLPYATLAVQAEIGEGKIMVWRELEANTQEKVELPLPALVTVQTGINEPRYVSIMGIRKVRTIKIKESDAQDLGLTSQEIGLDGSAIRSVQLALPQSGTSAEILSGSLDEICDKTASIVRKQGGLSS